MKPLPLLAAVVAAAQDCRSGVHDEWQAVGAAAGLTYHKNRCLKDEQTRAFAPPRCPRADAAVAASCLAARDIRHVVLVGDSITGQLWGTPLCAAPTERGLGDHQPNVTSYGFYAVARARLGPLGWTYLRVRGARGPASAEEG